MPPPVQQDTSPRYRIGTVARLTGISSYALRAWERRYAVVKPDRSAGGDRLYSDADVARLKLIGELLEEGHSIGQIARLPTAELERIRHAHKPREPGPLKPFVRTAPADTRAAFLRAITRLDLLEAEQVLSAALEGRAPREAVFEVLAPLVAEIAARARSGELYASARSLANQAVRGIAGTVLRQARPGADAPAVAVAAAAGEGSELEGVLATLLAAANRRRVVLLGADLPPAEVARAVEVSGAVAVIVAVESAEALAPGALVEVLRAAIPERVALLAAGAGARGKPPAGVSAAASLEALDRRLGVIGAKGARAEAAPGALRLAVLDERIPEQMQSGGEDMEGLELLWFGRDLQEFRSQVRSLRPDVLIVELTRLGKDPAREIARLLELSGARRALVTYFFARKEVIRALAAAPRTRPVREPLSLANLRAELPAG